MTEKYDMAHKYGRTAYTVSQMINYFGFERFVNKAANFIHAIHGGDLGDIKSFVWREMEDYENYFDLDLIDDADDMMEDLYILISEIEESFNEAQ